MKRFGESFWQMRISYTKQSLEHLRNIKNFIAQDSVGRANSFLHKLKSKIELLATFPKLGQVNQNFDDASVREMVFNGYKVIYKIEEEDVFILAVYKYIDYHLELTETPR